MYYKFTCNMTCTGKGYVEADSLEDAKQKILTGYYDDIYDETDHEVTKIVTIEEDDCGE